MSSARATIKGIRQGLLVTLGEGEWPDALHALESQFGENPAFFRGGRVALEVGDRSLTRAEIEQVRSIVGRHRIEMWALLSGDDATREAARSSGLVTDLDLSREPSPSRETAREPRVGAAVVRRTLRSGQTLRHPGDIVVIGDVNPGSELVAGGDIIVWGRLRGLVHAGALGSEDAVVCALVLSPTQLRIANHIARSPEERPKQARPEMASVRDGQIVAIPWPEEV